MQKSVGEKPSLLASEKRQIDAKKYPPIGKKSGATSLFKIAGQGASGRKKKTSPPPISFPG